MEIVFIRPVSFAQHATAPLQRFDTAVKLLAIVGSALVGLTVPAAGHSPGTALPPPPLAEASTLRSEDLRVAAITYRIGLHAAAVCAKHYPLTGLLLHHLPEYDRAGREEMTARHRLDRGPGILAVVADSPAALAGLLAGDAILRVDGAPLPSPTAMAAMSDAKAWRGAINRSEAMIEEALRKGSAQLTILRDGRELVFRIAPEPGCPARIRLARSRQTNAFATGDYVIVTTALLDFVRSDDELAVAIGHELAHNILGHPAELVAQNVPKGFLRGFGRNASRVRATEEEADRLGLRLIVAAGFDAAAAIPFWRRYYAAFDRAPQLFRTHPSLKARERLILDMLAELRAGQKPGDPLPKVDSDAR